MPEKEIVVNVDLFRCNITLCCFLWFVSTCVFAGVFGWSYSEWIVGTPFRLEEACRLTFSDDSVISEKEMRKWAGMEGWPLKHPFYDVIKRSCVCSTDSDPSSPSGDTPAWIAPGDLVSLYESGVSGKYLPEDFVSNYSTSFSPSDHVKVCIDQDRLLTLWNSDHCHVPGIGTEVKSITTGWDGSLYCTSGLTLFEANRI